MHFGAFWTGKVGQFPNCGGCEFSWAQMVSDVLPTWKSAIRQVWKPAIQEEGLLELIMVQAEKSCAWSGCDICGIRDAAWGIGPRRSREAGCHLQHVTRAIGSPRDDIAATSLLNQKRRTPPLLHGEPSSPEPPLQGVTPAT